MPAKTQHLAHEYFIKFGLNQIQALFCLLRIKTIFLEILEKRGIKIEEHKTLIEKIEEEQKKDVDFYSRNYLKLLQCQDKKSSKDVLLKFASDLMWTTPKITQWESKNQIKNVIDGLSVGVIHDVTQLNITDIIYIQDKNKQIIWNDVRVSRHFFRHIMKTNNFKSSSYNDLGEICMGKFIYLMYEDLKFYQQPRIIAFQCLLPLKIGVVSVNPRRISIINDKEQHVAFAHYQFLQLQEPQFKHETKVYRYDESLTAIKQQKYYQYLKNFKQNWKIVNQNNPNTFTCFTSNVVFSNLPPNQRNNASFSLNTCFKLEKGILKPALSKDTPIPLELRDQYKLMPLINEFVCEHEFLIIQDKFKSADDQIIKNVSDESGGLQLLRLIKSVPNLKFKLTGEQELMISTPQNILCLGRSGTGKTTSSALRLFATEVYYKYHELYRKFKLENPNARNADFKVPTDFLSQMSNIKLLFISASPVLVNEVKRFFIEFKTHFQLELQRSRGQEVESKKIEQFENYIELEIKQLEDEENLEKQSTLAQSMDYLNHEDFPLFLTVKRILYMLDASTDHPFFARNQQGEQIGMDSNVQWHNESGGVLMINQYFKSSNIDSQIKELGLKLIEYTEKLEKEPDSQTLIEQKIDDAQKSNKNTLGDFFDTSAFQFTNNFNKKGQNLSFEVDFEMFRSRFWPKVAQNVRITPIVAWTEICSEIKGRFDSWQYAFGGIPDALYIRANRNKNHFLTPEERFKVYEIFLLYEKWKIQQFSYDLNDLVNHILRQIKGNFLKECQLVHFLMVDEVQDLTQNIITLFMMLAEKNIFFSGDTAQTIAKGVGFRFFDLKSVFTKQNHESNQKFQVPKVLQLVKNFRSHSKILDLANSVVSLLELLFPRTIDKMIKESSDIVGPKPILIDSIQDKSVLFKLLEKYLLFGSIPSVNQSKQGQFGCTQVIIVRDQESKDEIPDFMRDMLCLTVYEAKGLEFDDVILYNFFKDSKCEGQWSLINDVTVSQSRVKIMNKAQFQNFDELECPDEQTQINTQSVEGDTEVQTVLKLKNNHEQVYRKFALICTELKLLYVAITRPKNFLIIYDDDFAVRKPIQDYFLSSCVVDHIDKFKSANLDLLPEHIKKTLRISDTPQIDEKNGKYQSESIKQTWQLQGLKLFKVRFYRAAAQCFKNMGSEDLVKRCHAYESADLASQIKSQHDRKLAQSFDKRINKKERIQFKREAQDQLKEYREQMTKAGKLFCEINMNQHAAQCFYSSGKLDFSAELFIKQDKHGPAAECYHKLKQFKKAAFHYLQAKLYTNAFECYEYLQDWDGLMQALFQHKQNFSQVDLNILLEKYLPIALNSAYEIYSGGDEMMSEENKGKIQLMKLKLKFQKSVSVIMEENADEVESVDSDSEQEVAEEKTSKTQNSQIEDQSDSIVIINTTQNQSDSIVMINTTQNQSDSIVMINTTQNQSNLIEILDKSEINLDENKQLEFELLSNIDPEDEFLRSQKSYSLLESLTSNDSSFEVLQSQQSEYSIISNTSIYNAIKSMQQSSIDLDGSGFSLQNSFEQLKYSMIQQVQGLEDADDLVIQKVIYFISLFKEEVKSIATDPLSQVCQSIGDDFNFMMIELDELSSDMVDLVIKTLENYEMYRLCIMLHQRFKPKQNVARFASAICKKYSNLNQFRVLCMEQFKSKEAILAQKKYAMIANEAVQNVFTLVASQQQQFSFDPEFESLFLLGYWKKLIFMMSSDCSIELSWVMSDLNAIQILFLVQKAGSNNLNLDQTNIMEHLKQQKKSMSKLQYQLICSAIYEKEADEAISEVLLAKNQNEIQKVHKKFLCLQNKLSFYKHLVEKKINFSRSIFYVFKFLSLKNIQQGNYVKYELIMHALTFMWKSFSSPHLQRSLYKAFGCSLIDGLDTFKLFSNNYCVLKTSSPLFNHVQKRQMLAVQEIKLALMRSELNKLRGSNVVENLGVAKQKCKQQLESMSFKQQLDYQIALVCDINLEYYLVPKDWVKDALLMIIFQLVTDIDDVDYKLQIVDKALGISKYQKQFEIEQFQSKLGTQIDERTAYFYCFGTGFVIPEKIKYQSIVDKLKNIRQLCCKQLYPIQTRNLKIQLSPKYTQFQCRDQRDGCLESAIELYNSVKDVTLDKSADISFRILKAFQRLDAIPVLEELLKYKKQQKLQFLNSLIQSDFQSKCNNLAESSKFILQFLANTYTTLSFPYFYNLVTEAFSKAWFSYEIYNSKEGVIALTVQDAECVTPSLRIDQQANQTLVDIRIAIGNEQIVKNALIWVECFLMNLHQYEGNAPFMDYFKYGWQVIQTVFMSDTATIKLFLPKLKLIYEATIKGTDIYKAQFNDLLKNVENKQKFNEMKKAITNHHISPYITFELQDRKQVVNRINQINLDVFNCIKEASTFYQNHLDQRKLAANKIVKYWYMKKQGKVAKKPKNYELQRQITQFICSNIPHSTQESLILFEQLRNNDDIKNWEEFLNSLSNEKQSNFVKDQERKKFMKREKWDNFIQFHTKKRTMLRHFKQTMKK